MVAVDVRVRIAGLDLAAKFAQTGRWWTEANTDGQPVHRGAWSYFAAGV